MLLMNDGFHVGVCCSVTDYQLLTVVFIVFVFIVFARYFYAKLF